jgi:hypothetical protein
MSNTRIDNNTNTEYNQWIAKYTGSPVLLTSIGKGGGGTVYASHNKNMVVKQSIYYHEYQTELDTTADTCSGRTCTNDGPCRWYVKKASCMHTILEKRKVYMERRHVDLNLSAFGKSFLREVEISKILCASGVAPIFYAATIMRANISDSGTITNNDISKDMTYIHTCIVSLLCIQRLDMTLLTYIQTNPAIPSFSCKYDWGRRLLRLFKRSAMSGIICCDQKFGNVLIDINKNNTTCIDRMKLCDFGGGWSDVPWIHNTIQTVYPGNFISTRRLRVYARMNLMMILFDLHTDMIMKDTMLRHRDVRPFITMCRDVLGTSSTMGHLLRYIIVFSTDLRILRGTYCSPLRYRGENVLSYYGYVGNMPEFMLADNFYMRGGLSR